MLLAFAQFFASLGIIMYGGFRLDAGVRQLPMDTLRDYLFKVFKNPIRASIFGFTSGAILANILPQYLIIGSLIGMHSVNIYYASLVMIWVIPGSLTLYYLTAVPIKSIVLLLFGLLCFITSSHQFKKYTSVMEAFFGLILVIYGSILLSQSMAAIRLFPWFTTVLAQAKISHMFIFIIGMLIWVSVKSVWVALLINAGAMEIEGFQISQVVSFLAGTCAAISLYGMYTFRQKRIGYKQLSALHICFYAVSAILLAIWGGVSVTFNRPDFINWVYAFGTSSRLVSGNILMSGLLGSALILSFSRSIISKYIEWLCPIGDVDDPSQPKYIETQAINAPEIAMDMVQREQVRYLYPLLAYIEIARERAALAERNLIRIHDELGNLYPAVEIFLKELSERQVSDQTVERFLNLNIRQKAFKALETEIFRFASMCISPQESAPIKSLMESMLEALDITLMNLKDIFEVEAGIATEHDVPLHTLLIDRGEIIENIRKSFLDKQSGFSIGEKKDVLDATLHFEKSLWLVEQLAKQVIDTHHSYSEHVEIKQRWMRQLASK